MKQIKIQDLLPLLHHGWVALDKDGDWNFFREKPKRSNDFWCAYHGCCCLNFLFNIAPYEGDWKDSLMECGK